VVAATPVTAVTATLFGVVYATVGASAVFVKVENPINGKAVPATGAVIVIMWSAVPLAGTLATVAPASPFMGAARMSA
jgi:hypothetical protein